jgi:hypothetical protein
MNNFIDAFIKFFKGEESLKKSFWLFYLVGMYSVLIAQVFTNRFFPLKYIFEIYLVFASIGLWKCLNRINKEWNLKTNQQFNKDIRSNFLQGFLVIFLKLIIIVNFLLYIFKVYYWWDLMMGKL